MAPLSEIQRRCGSIGLIALALTGIGILCFAYALSNRGGLAMSCEHYLAEKPVAKWAKLDGCVLSRIESVAKTSAGKSATEVYIPVRPASQKGRADTHILLASTAQEDIDFVNHANGPESQRSNRAAFLSSFGSKIEEKRGVEGRIFRASTLPDRERAKLMKTLPTLAPDFIIIEECERPGFGLSVTLLLAGAALGAFRLVPLLKKKALPASAPAADELLATK